MFPDFVSGTTILDLRDAIWIVEMFETLSHGQRGMSQLCSNIKEALRKLLLRKSSTYSAHSVAGSAIWRVHSDLHHVRTHPADAGSMYIDRNNDD